MVKTLKQKKKKLVQTYSYIMALSLSVHRDNI